MLEIGNLKSCCWLKEENTMKAQMSISFETAFEMCISGQSSRFPANAGHAVITFCHLFWESDFFAFVSFALTIPSWVPCYRAAHDPALSSPELTPCPILAVGGSNGSMSRNGSKYGGGGGFTTPTKDYEPVGGDRHGNADLNGSSRLNGNGRPDVYDIPSGKYVQYN